MLLEEINAMYGPIGMFNYLTQTKQHVATSFQSLLDAIDQGWQIEEPLQVMPTAREDIWMYFIVLKHPAQSNCRRLIVPALPEVERYVEHNHYQAVESRFCYWDDGDNKTNLF